MEKPIQYIVSFIFIGIFIFGLTMVIVPTKGPKYCSKNLNEVRPHFTGDMVQIDSSYTRTLNNQWVAALAFQPLDLSQNEVTVVCSFKATNYVFKNLIIYNGNQISKLQSISTSNYNPTTWLNYND